MVVDDDAFIASDIETSLVSQGAIVIGPGYNVQSALELIENNSVEAAVLDVNLQREMIFPVADVLTNHKIPIIFQTGIACPDAIQALYPTAKVLKKPTRRDDLLNNIIESLKSR